MYTTNEDNQISEKAEKDHVYEASRIDIDVIRDLLIKLIPTFRTDNLIYSATDIAGKSQTISKDIEMKL